MLGEPPVPQELRRLLSVRHTWPGPAMLSSRRCYPSAHMTQPAAIEAQLRELDIAIDAAVSNLDATTLDRLLADDFVYTHAGGKPEPKREFIATAVARVDPP